MERGSEDQNIFEQRERERLIERALNTLAKNIEFSDQKSPQSLKKRLLAADQNPLRRATGETLNEFNTVQVEGFIGEGEREGSIFLRPYLAFKDREFEGGMKMNVQPMSLHLNMIERDKEKRLELAEEIWSGVSQEEKIALALRYIEWKRKTEEEGLAHVSTYTDDYFSSSRQRKSFEDQYRHIIKVLHRLESAIKQNTFSIEFSDSSASLIFSPVIK